MPSPSPTKQIPHRQRGQTLVEVCLVIVLLFLVVAASLPQVGSVINDILAKAAATIANAAQGGGN